MSRSGRSRNSSKASKWRGGESDKWFFSSFFLFSFTRAKVNEFWVTRWWTYKRWAYDLAYGGDVRDEKNIFRGRFVWNLSLLKLFRVFGGFDSFEWQETGGVYMSGMLFFFTIRQVGWILAAESLSRGISCESVSKRLQQDFGVGDLESWRRRKFGILGGNFVVSKFLVVRKSYEEFSS